MSTLNGQVIGQAHYATRALLEQVLTRTGISFEQSVALNTIAASENRTIAREQLVTRMTGTLKVERPAVEAVLAALSDAGLLEPLPNEELGLTDRGAALNDEIRGAIGELTQRLYGDFSAEELAIAGRVLTALTERANQELALV
jgi:DNA-binding MarR family transcriptional regulator